MKVQRRKSRLVIVLGLVMALVLSTGGAFSAHASAARNVSVEPSTPVLAMSGVDVSNAPENVPVGWWATVQADIRQSEYQVTWQEGTRLPDLAAAYQAPNRAQDLRVYLTPDGVRVVRRTSTQPAWVWGYRFESPAEPVLASPHRIEYRQPGVTVWYENGQSGIVQGFVVEGPPADGGPLELMGVLTGDLLPKGAGESVDFLYKGVPMVRLGDLQATDAQGQALAARLEVAGGLLRIVVEDEGIAYPVTVTARITSPDREVEDRAGVMGLSTTPDWMATGDQVDAHFGFSVNTAGDVNGDGYDDVIVGANLYDNGEEDEGIAVVYHGSATGLSLTPDWMAEGDQAGAYFGWAVSTAGDVNGDGYADVVIGAYRYDNGHTDEGRAYVYHGSASGLNTTADWIVEGNQTDARLGRSAGTAGDVDDDGYDEVIIGAPLYNAGQTDEGRVYLYHGSDAGLSTTPDWMAEGDQGYARFGNRVNTAGDVNDDGYDDVIIGARNYDGGQTDEGRAYVYHGSDLGLSTTADWTAESDQAYARFGWWVGTAGDVNGDGYADVIISAMQYDGGQTDEGRAYAYHGSASGLSATPDWTAEGDQAGANFGWSAGTAGDVNGDGYADVIVGAQYYDSGQTDEGIAFVYHGSAAGLNPSADWTAEGDQAGARLGRSAGTAGDVNGDDLADVIVGALFYDDGEMDEGAAFVYLAVTPIAGLEAINDSPTVLGNVTTLTATIEAGSHLTYTWALGDGASGSGAVVTHTYPAAGEYMAVVTASNSVNELTATTTVVVGEAIAGLSAMNDSPTVLGEITTLTATVTAGSNVSYTWDLGDGAFGSGAVVTRTYPAVGEYTAVVTASNSVNELTATTTVVVEEAIAGLNAVNDSPTVLGEVTTLTATVTAGSNVSYTWALDDGASGSGAVVTHTYPAVGVYTAVVTASNSVSELTATTVVMVTELHFFYLPFAIKIP